VVPEYTDASVQVIGTFGGMTVTFEGSNMISSPTYAQLKEVDKTAIAFTAAGIKTVLESVYQVRPARSGGSSADVDIYFKAVRR
jgi:hypothetical protein